MTSAEQAFVPGRADLCFHSLPLFHQSGPQPAHFVLITESGKAGLLGVNYLTTTQKCWELLTVLLTRLNPLFKGLAFFEEMHIGCSLSRKRFELRSLYGKKLLNCSHCGQT